MGIPSYFSYIVKNHASIIRKLSDNLIKADNLYLDSNSTIYDVIHKMDVNPLFPGKMSSSDITNYIISKVIETIKEYITTIKPKNRVFIAFDGVAPVAKIEQQRSRRFKSLYQNSVSKSLLKNDKADPWNTTAITPGTVFMNSLNEQIAIAFNNPALFNLKSIIVSGSDKYGEGEHKIFKYIRDNAEDHREQNTVIYGLDADLIMLSINHLPISPNIYLFRETPHFIQSINSELEPNESYLLDIPELANIITLDMNNGRELTCEQQSNRIYDYIFLCFFLGNDFMPHFPAVNIRTGGVDKMLNAYKATIGPTNENLTDGKTIYWKNVRKLVQFLADNETEYLKQEHKKRDKKEKYKLPDITAENKIDKFINIPTFDRTVEKYINPYNNNWQSRYYNSLFDMEINEENNKMICMNYLEGLEWTMKYYTTDCCDWRWCYRYNYPPLLSDLIKYIPCFNKELIENKPDKPLTELVQLCYVLPKQSLLFLPDNLYKALIKEKLDLYRTDCDFSWAYCRYFWEAHPNLPHMDVAELEEFVKGAVL
jgi:5'-3' exoribonuclease 1